MKKIVAIIALLSFYTTHIHTTPIFIHDHSIKAQNGRFIARYGNVTPEQVNITDIPQQRINITDAKKNLSLRAHPFSKKKPCYLRITSNNKPQEAVELLIKKEPLHKDLKEQLTTEEAALFKNKTVCLYRKTKERWVPLATIPADDAPQLISEASLHPDGTISL